MKRTRWLLALAALLALIIVLLTTFRPHDPLPHPNGYDDFVAAGKMVVGDVWAGNVQIDRQDKVEMARFAARNEPVLSRVRLGLSREVLVPVTVSSEGWATVFRNSVAVQQAGSAISVIAEQKAAEGRMDEAVAINLDCIRLAIAASRGGLEQNCVLACGDELEAVRRLLVLAPKLDAARCRDTLKALSSLQQGREPREVVRRRERHFFRRLGAWWRTWSGITNMVVYIFDSKDPLETVVRLDREILPIRNSLSVALAERAFTLEKGRRPANDDELVPEYLPVLPYAPLPAK
jgi:hypothetical protein